MLRHLPPSIRRQRQTGPLGRLARLGLFTLFAVSLYSIVDGQGSARFRNPHILSEPSAWLLHVTMLIVFVVLVGTLAAALVAGRRQAELDGRGIRGDGANSWRPSTNDWSTPANWCRNARASPRLCMRGESGSRMAPPL
jgi:hypothetical protein